MARYDYNHGDDYDYFNNNQNVPMNQDVNRNICRKNIIRFGKI